MGKFTATLMSSVIVLGCLGCASKRTIASFESGGRSRSIPENRVRPDTLVENSTFKFALKENKVVISKIESSTFFNRTDGKYILQIDGRTIDGLISAEGQLTQNEASEKNSSELPAELLTQSKIIITKDWSNTREFFEWRQNVTNGKVERKSVSIIFLDKGGEESRINLYDTYPTKWKGPQLNAKASAHAAETIELTASSYEIKSDVIHF